MFDPILKKLAHGLSSCEIPYMVIGGQAVLIYGEPRLTRDVDGQPVQYASLEDLVIHKIIAGRPRDIEDVQNMMRKQALSEPS